jgi:hypothetical protein
MALLDSREWSERIFSGGWIEGAGESYDSIEPATGDTLSRVGAATPDDLAPAVERATHAQRSWAALPYIERAQVLRRAARVFEDNLAEIADWILNNPIETVQGTFEYRPDEQNYGDDIQTIKQIQDGGWYVVWPDEFSSEGRSLEGPLR